jgi:hypothetical protein
MRNNDDPVGDPAPPSSPEAPTEAPRLREALVPVAIALAAGGVVLTVAVAAGAAEAAVSVGAVYLVFSALTRRRDLSDPLVVRLLTGMLGRSSG